MIRLISESFTHFKLHVAKGIIDVYEHKGRKLGIFLNGNQIGIIEKSKYVNFGGDIYKILIDSNEIVKELAIAFILSYDNFAYNNGSMFKIDFGNILIKPEKEIDPNWTPID